MNNRWTQLALVLLVTTVVYLPIFRNGFVIDDHVFVGKYQPTIVEAFLGAVPPGHEGVYRPVRGLIYTVYYELFGTNLLFYHLHSLLVHLVATALVYFIVFQLSSRPLSRDPAQNKDWIPAFAGMTRGGAGMTGGGAGMTGGGAGMTAGVAALLFGLHPVHTESITYIASSMDMTGVVFMLGALWLYLKATANGKRQKENVFRLQFSVYLSYIFALLAFFTNEMTITLPLLLVLYKWILRVPSVIPANAGIQRRNDWIPVFTGMTQPVLPYFLGAGGYLFIRFVILGIAGRSTYPGGSIWYALLTLPKVLVHYLWVTIWPVNLMNNHILSPGIEAFVYRGYRTAGILGQSILDPEILFSIGLIGLICLIGLKLRKKYPFVFFGIFWFFLTLLPVMGFMPQGSMFNERMLYVPTVGWVMMAAYAIGRWGEGKIGRWGRFGVTRRRRSVARAAMARRRQGYGGQVGMIIVIGVIVLFYGVRTVVRNADWHDDVTLWQKDVAEAPTENAYAYFALGNAYNSRKEFDRAIAAYAQSVAINPGFAVGYASLSRTYRDMGNTELSNINYELAERAEPGFWGRP